MDEAPRTKLINRTHALGVGANAGLAALKLSVGGIAGSRALVADGIHSLSDVVMNAAAWFGWRWASRPRDADHHYGHGNGEALTTLIVGVIVISAGIGLVWSALSGTSTVQADLLGALAIAVEALTVAVKIGLARITGRRGRDLHSPILVAVSRDNRADVLTSTLVMIAIAGAISGLTALEPIAAAAIGALIIRDGLRSVREGLDVLMDRSPDPTLRQRIAEVAAAVDGVACVDDLRVHPLGTHLRVDMEIAIDGHLEIRDGHAIAHAVERAVTSAVPEITEVAVHVNPAPTPGSDDDAALPAAR
ncbi:MAG: cation transporter [Myxococcales bacterium]|nr:cation transporter [Myxococcales bacterium]